MTFQPRLIWGSLALAASLGLPSLTFAQDCCPTEGARLAGPTLSGQTLDIEIADDEAEMKELEERLNEILVVDESGELVLREEFKGSLPFPPERVERMLGAFVELDENGKVRIKNKEMVRPYLPMMRRFLSQGGMDKLKELQKLPPEERRKAMQRLMGEAQGQNEEKAKPAPKAPKAKPAPKPKRPARAERRERDEPRRARRNRTERRNNDSDRARGGQHSDRVHNEVMRRLAQMDQRLRRIEGLLQRMERAHGDMQRGQRDDRGWGRRDRDESRGWGRRDRDEDRGWGRRGRRSQRGDRGFNPERLRRMMEQFGGGRDGFNPERMREMMERFGRGGRGFDPERMRDMFEQFGGGRDGFNPERLRDMFEQFGGEEGLRKMMEGFGGGEGFDPERLRDMMEQFGGEEGLRKMMEGFRGRRGEGRREGRRRGRRMRDMVQEGGESLGNVGKGLNKLMELMNDDDKKALKKALGSLAKDFDPQDMQDPSGLMDKLSGTLTPEEMSRLMEVFSEFLATDEGRALQEEVEKMTQRAEGFSNGEEGQKLMGMLRQLEERLGGKGQLGDRLEGLMRGRDKGRRAPRTTKRPRRTEGQPGYGQKHPKNPKARLY